VVKDATGCVLVFDPASHQAQDLDFWYPHISIKSIGIYTFIGHFYSRVKHIVKEAGLRSSQCIIFANKVAQEEPANQELVFCKTSATVHTYQNLMLD
jgi:hypothetical protein